MNTLLWNLARRGFREFWRTGSSTWLAVGMSAVVVRYARRFLRDEPDRVYVAKLRPGQHVEVRAVPPR